MSDPVDPSNAKPPTGESQPPTEPAEDTKGPEPIPHGSEFGPKTAMGFFDPDAPADLDIKRAVLGIPEPPNDLDSDLTRPESNEVEPLGPLDQMPSGQTDPGYGDPEFTPPAGGTDVPITLPDGGETTIQIPAPTRMSVQGSPGSDIGSLFDDGSKQADAPQINPDEDLPPLPGDKPKQADSPEVVPDESKSPIRDRQPIGADGPHLDPDDLPPIRDDAGSRGAQRVLDTRPSLLFVTLLVGAALLAFLIVLLIFAGWIGHTPVAAPVSSNVASGPTNATTPQATSAVSNAPQPSPPSSQAVVSAPTLAPTGVPTPSPSVGLPGGQIAISGFGPLKVQFGSCISPTKPLGTMAGDANGTSWQAAFGPQGSFTWIVQTTPSDTYKGQNVYVITGSGPTETIEFNGTLADAAGKTITISGGGTCQDLNLGT